MYIIIIFIDIVIIVVNVNRTSLRVHFHCFVCFAVKCGHFSHAFLFAKSFALLVQSYSLRNVCLVCILICSFKCVVLILILFFLFVITLSVFHFQECCSVIKTSWDARSALWNVWSIYSLYVLLLLLWPFHIGPLQGASEALKSNSSLKTRKEHSKENGRI